MLRRSTVAALLGASATVGATLSASLIGSIPVGAAPSGACVDSNGVTVIVDFGALGGGVQTGCAVGPQSSGLNALRNAGFAFDGTVRYPAFVCRINGVPTSDRCLDASPATATWAYFTASRGGRWTYSNLGAATAAAPAGSVQGWSWSTGTNPPPSVDPPGAFPPPTAAPTAAPPTTPSSSPSTPNTAAPGATSPNAATPNPATPSPGAPKPATPNPTPARPPATSSGAGDTPAASPSEPSVIDNPAAAPADPNADAEVMSETTLGNDDPGDDAGEAAVDDSRADDEREIAADGSVTMTDEASTGSAVPTLIAAGTIAVLGATAVGLTRRRRSGV